MHVNVAIIGLDRLGASFGLALKRYQNQPKAEHTFTIMGNDTQGHAMKSAQKIGAVDDFHRQLLKATANADLIIMNAPYGSIEELYMRMGPELKPGAVVLDLSQLKQPVIELARQYFPTHPGGRQVAYVVGMTPIINAAGLYSGEIATETARPDLFDNAEILLAPDAQCPSEAISLAEDVIRLVGGTARFIDPIEHDGLIAATEGLPSLLGTAMFYLLQQSEGWLELRRMINPSLALTMQNLRTQSQNDLHALFTQNRENLVRHLEGLIGMLDQVRDALTDDTDSEQLDAFLSVVQSEWDKWDVKRHSGKWEDVKEPEVIAGPFGSVGGFLTGRRRAKDEETDD